MNWDEFEHWAKHIAEWSAQYHRTLRDRPVRAQVNPGDILASLPKCPPEGAESMTALMADFEQIIMPGMTHWQHPRFFAYFPANAAPPSMLAEMLVTALAAQCMLWQTSPAATEVETRMLDWLRQAIGLPDRFAGVIQDSASSATLAAVLTMRERALEWQGNSKGLAKQPQLRIYASGEVHTSIDRAIWVAGVGQENLVRIPVSGELRGMDPAALDAAIANDIRDGYLPAGIIACTGATGMGACDDIAAVAGIARRHGLYVHVDAAWAGAAMICPEFRSLWQGVEMADSVVFNPHKWLGAQFDCSAHFISDPEKLVKTLAIQPEYLKTHGHDGLINYSEWTVPLGRRFRALKIWFLIRAYGLEGLRQRIRNHVEWARELAEALRQHSSFEIVTDPILSLFTFRLKGLSDEDHIAFVNRVNDDGRIYITQTRLDGRIVVRFQAGQFDCTRDDVMMVLDVLTELAA